MAESADLKNENIQVEDIETKLRQENVMQSAAVIGNLTLCDLIKEILLIQVENKTKNSSSSKDDDETIVNYLKEINENREGNSEEEKEAVKNHQYYDIIKTFTEINKTICNMHKQATVEDKPVEYRNELQRLINKINLVTLSMNCFQLEMKEARHQMEINYMAVVVMHKLFDQKFEMEKKSNYLLDDALQRIQCYMRNEERYVRQLKNLRLKYSI